MKPLSVYTYFINNKRKVIPFIISIAIGTFLLYFLCFMANSAIKGGLAAWVNPMEHTSIIYSINGTPIDKSIIQDLKNNNDIEKIIPVDIQSTAYKNMLGGSTGSTVLKASYEDVKEIMKIMNLEIKSGKMPQNDGEILLDHRLATINKMSLGDYIGDEVNEEEDIKGKYKIVGTIEGDSVISFISDNKITNNYAYVIIPKKNKIKDVNDYLYENIEGFEVISLRTAKEDMKRAYDSIDIIFYSIEILVIFVLCVTIGNTTYMHYLQRKSEFGLLSAVGYRKKDIINRILKEVFFINIFGFILGISLGIFIAYILKIVLMDPNGQIYSIFSFNYVYLTLFVPLFVIIFSSIPSIIMINKSDKINIIEGN